MPSCVVRRGGRRGGGRREGDRVLRVVSPLGARSDGHNLSSPILIYISPVCKHLLFLEDTHVRRVILNFFFKLPTFPSNQNFPTHTNFQLFRHIIPISTKLSILT